MISSISLTDALFDGAKEVFETMIFMSLEKSQEPVEEPECESLMGTVTFKGNLQGCVGICCSLPCAQSIAANMMALEPGSTLDENQVCDAMGEVANMVMGSFKTRILPEVGNVEVSIPSVVNGKNLGARLLDGQERSTITIMIDEHVATLTLLSKLQSN